MMYFSALKLLRRCAPGLDGNGKIASFKDFATKTVLVGFDWDNKRIRGWKGLASLLLTLAILYVGVCAIGMFYHMFFSSFAAYLPPFLYVAALTALLIFLQTLLMESMLIPANQKRELKSRRQAN